MKQILLYLSLFLFPLFTYSQLNSSLDLIGGIEYGYRNLSSSSVPVVVSVRDDIEIGKINFRIGFNYNKRLSEKIFFKTGLRFAISGYKNRENELRFGDQQIGGAFEPSIPSCLLYTSPSPRDATLSRMPSSA